jgi:hypothetical protein
MSKSRKKTPIYKPRSAYYRRFIKRQANKRVRKEESVKDGKHFRRFFPTDEIYEYTSYYSLNERLIAYRNPCSYMHKVFSNEKEAIEDWKATNYRK